MSALSLSIPSLYAVGHDPRLEKIFERVKSVEDLIRYLQSRATTLHNTDKVRSDKNFKELEAVIETLLKDLVFDLWNTKSSTSDELSWLWLPPDYAADLRDFLGRPYCMLKLVEGIHEENLRMESTSVDSSPATLGHQSPESNEHLERFRADLETSPTSPSQQLHQDNRHQRAISCVCDELAELSEVFNYHHYRLREYVVELKDRHTAQREALKHFSLAVESAANCLQPLSISPLGASKCLGNCTTQEESSALLQQDERISKARLGNDRLKQKRKASDQSFKNGAKFSKYVCHLQFLILTLDRS